MAKWRVFPNAEKITTGVWLHFTYDGGVGAFLFSGDALAIDYPSGFQGNGSTTTRVAKNATIKIDGVTFSLTVISEQRGESKWEIR